MGKMAHFARKPAATAALDDRRKYIPPILTALIVAISVNVGNLPAWIVVWCAMLWGYLLISLEFSWPWPGKILRFVLFFAGIAGLLMTFTTRLGPAAYFGLLAVMAALKPFEISTHRDRMVTLFLAYFIVIASLFQSNSLLITLYMLASVFVTTAALVRINNPQGNFRAGLRVSGLIMAQAAPLMVVLFLLFPRLQGSLFGLPTSTVAQTGFTDRLTFGSVSRLAVSNQEAFRAVFDGRVPPPAKLYWRGIVFDRFDGRTWHRSHGAQTLPRPPKGNDPVSYTIVLGPTGSRWLFALDLPGTIPQGARMDSDYTLRLRHPVNETMAYSMTSYQGFRERAYGRRILREDTRLPATGNPKSRALARQLTQDAGTVAEKVRRVLAYFKDNGFVYTLTPQVLGKDPVDEFLFDSKQGYCQHYAVAFAFLMRAAGVPTRLVGGYLGGELNKFGNSMIVRRSDAHVWDEVFEPGKGWVRVDPTAVVAPGRISGDLRGGLLLADLPGSRILKYLGPFAPYVSDIEYGWEAITTAWSAWFYAYSADQQKALLNKIGIHWGTVVDIALAIGLILVLGAGIVFGYIAIGMKKANRKADAVGRSYQQFCTKLARIGLVRAADQGAVAFSRQVQTMRPDLQQAVGEITELYVRLRFRPDPEPDAARQFVALVRTFRPGRVRES